MKPYIIMLILLASTASAYVKPIQYHGIPVRFYSASINQTECFQMFDKLNTSDLQGLRSISIYTRVNKRFAGYYLYNERAILLYNGCQEFTVFHELAHHCQTMAGDTLKQAQGHTGQFDECRIKVDPYYRWMRE